MPCATGAVLIDAVTRRQRPYRSNHPLAIPRTALALDLIRAWTILRKLGISKSIQMLIESAGHHLCFRA